MTMLEGRVAVVTGASRGAGRGVAIELGAAGATVYVTGRSSRGRADPHPLASAFPFLREIPGTVEETADLVNASGGVGHAVVVDHRRKEEVEALFLRIEREHGRLDVLVNNAWAGNETLFATPYQEPFWKQDIQNWEGTFEGGVRNHILSSQAAAPLLVRAPRGLVVTTTFWDHDRYCGNLFYDLAKCTMNRLALALAHELKAHNVTSVALSPGFMRTELVQALAKHGEENGDTGTPTESPRYLGRAVVALALDSGVPSKTGRTLYVADLAREYGFTDTDGTQPGPFRLP